LDCLNMLSSSELSSGPSGVLKPLATMYFCYCNHQHHTNIEHYFLSQPSSAPPNIYSPRPSVELIDPYPGTPPPSSSSPIGSTTASFEAQERLTLLSLWKVSDIEQTALNVAFDLRLRFLGTAESCAFGRWGRRCRGHGMRQSSTIHSHYSQYWNLWALSDF
jgi:hypothetical protein